MKYLFLIFLLSCTKIENKVQSGNNSELTTTHPNIILILGDDVGYEVLTSDGGGSYDTHLLDSIANLGMRYTWCHATPLCSPSRHELLTGKYNFRNYTEWGNMGIGNKTIGNMFHDAGYATAVYGKWQLGNANTSIPIFGFDRYAVYEPFQVSDTDEVFGNRYKNPLIYSNGNYTQYSDDQYGEDIMTDSVINFMATASKPFFIYYPMLLCHLPFQPTPDDPDYLSFDETNNHSVPSYYTSMAKYMSKKVNEVYAAVDSLGLSNNTIIVFTGDNGCPGVVRSLYKGLLLGGGKHQTIERGSHVPLIVSGIGQGVDSTLIDFTDFLPTLARLAGIPKPTTYGILDGVTFTGTSKKRTWVFCQYWPNPEQGDSSTIARWVQNKIYKIYDTLAYPDYKKGAFFKYNQGGANETEANVIDSPTVSQANIRNNLQVILNKMHN